MATTLPAPAFPLGRAKLPARVLIVDDEPLVRWALSSGLRLAGFETICAATAREAIALTAARPAPDVILLDASIDGAGTFALAEALRYASPASWIVTLATGSEPAPCAAAAMTITKPFDLNDVVRLINRTRRGTG
jgi:DNA-binding NtrC family response regulator